MGSPTSAPRLGIMLLMLTLPPSYKGFDKFRRIVLWRTKSMGRDGGWPLEAAQRPD